MCIHTLYRLESFRYDTDYQDFQREVAASSNKQNGAQLACSKDNAVPAAQGTLPSEKKGLMVILSMLSFKHLRGSSEVTPFLRVVMKCLKGGVRGLLGPSYIISAFKQGPQILSSPCPSTLQGTKMKLHLTLSLYKNPEQWMST